MVKVGLIGCEGCGNKVGFFVGRRAFIFHFLHSKDRCPE